MGDEGKKPEETRRRPMVVSKGWVQGIALVMILGFTVMGILAYHTYNDSIPIPDKVVLRFPPDRGGLAATRRPGRASRWSARN